MKKKLIKALQFLPDGFGIDLGEDTFLTGYLDGSDKIYGFGRDGDDIIVIAGTMFNYPIGDMDKPDLKYIFNLSDIYEKILRGEYEVVDIDFI